MTQELGQLNAFKATFDNLVEDPLRSSDSEGDGEQVAARSSGADGHRAATKWKQRARRLQEYVRWQLAEAEARVGGVPVHPDPSALCVSVQPRLGSPDQAGAAAPVPDRVRTKPEYIRGRGHGSIVDRVKAKVSHRKRPHPRRVLLPPGPTT